MLRHKQMRLYFKRNHIRIGSESLNILMDRIEQIFKNELNKIIEKLRIINHPELQFNKQLEIEHLNPFVELIKTQYSDYYKEEDFDYIRNKNKNYQTYTKWREYFVYKSEIATYMNYLRVDTRMKTLEVLSWILDRLAKNEVNKLIQSLPIETNGQLKRNTVKREDITSLYDPKKPKQDRKPLAHFTKIKYGKQNKLTY